MKITHVEDFFHPNAGYQLNLLSKLQNEDGHFVNIITSELLNIPKNLTEFFGDEDVKQKDLQFSKKFGVLVERLPTLGYYSGRSVFNPFKLLKKIHEINPDIVFVHGMESLTSIFILMSYPLLGRPIVLDTHMLEMASTNKMNKYFYFLYRTIITPIIVKNNIPVIRVVDSNFVEKFLGLPLSKTTLLSFGTDTSYFVPDEEKGRKKRNALGISDNSFLVLYAGKLDDSKGGLFLANAIKKKMISENNREIEFLIIGNSYGEYGNQVEKVFSISENKITRISTQSYYDLVEFYQMADLAVFPKQCSLSFFEVQSCGVPVLFEDNEINSQRIDNMNAFLFKSGDMNEFRRMISYLCNQNNDMIQLIKKNSRRYVQSKYDYGPIAKEFTKVMLDASIEYKKRGRHR
jgi:glycosyltransferase involved in cell wall biosynthesis